MKIKQLYLVAFLITVFAIPTQAQSYTEVVWKQIQNSYEENAEMGYVVKNYIIGMIQESDDNTWSFYLDSSKEYLFEGFCDEDCEDLDLYLYNDEGTELDKDVEEDDFPLFFFEPERSGHYKVNVTMYSCSVEPCYFGLAIFEK
ncbi:MAG: hypothetical protein JJ971_14910 [Balneolaceae bacterium]|nr:hypothetical protein [Balneolaceae bacterium]MBO6547689.1 hypothetical protein [Balneolaceae bacterium]MBO6648200.1 hypothetical protein [Balneolaceae bacterium]